MNSPQLELKEQVKSWIKKELKIGKDCVVLITEANCKNDCPDLDTVVMIYEDCDKSKMMIYKINKPLNEISEEDIKSGMIAEKLFNPKKIKLNDLALNDKV